MRRTLTFGALAFWIVALILVVQRHEMWRDELQAWSIAAPATSLADLWHRAAYEPDPNLWFVVLYAAGRISSAPPTIQIVNGLIAVACAALVLLRAPFPLRVRLLLAFGYMMFYEWGVISRPYALVVLLAFSSAEALRRRTSVVIPAVLLFQLMTASMYGVLLAAPPGALLLWRCWKERQGRPAVRLAAMIIVAAGFACAAAKLNRPPDALFPQDAHHALGTLSSVTEGFLPLVPLRRDFWNAAVLPLQLSAAAGALLLGVAVWTAGTNLARALFATGAGALLVATYFISNGAWRHHGLLLIAYVCALWATQSSGRAGVHFLTAILVVQCLSTITAVVNDWRYDFSSASRAARFIEEKGWRDALLIGYPDHTASAVAGYLERDIFFVNGARMGRYAVWDTRRFQTDFRPLAVTVSRGLRSGRTVVAIAGSGRKFQVPGFQLVAEFGPATVSDESYRIYLVRPNGHSTGP